MSPGTLEAVTELAKVIVPSVTAIIVARIQTRRAKPATPSRLLSRRPKRHRRPKRQPRRGQLIRQARSPPSYPFVLSAGRLEHTCESVGRGNRVRLARKFRTLRMPAFLRGQHRPGHAIAPAGTSLWEVGSCTTNSGRRQIPSG